MVFCDYKPTNEFSFAQWYKSFDKQRLAVNKIHNIFNRTRLQRERKPGEENKLEACKKKGTIQLERIRGVVQIVREYQLFSSFDQNNYKTLKTKKSTWWRRELEDGAVSRKRLSYINQLAVPYSWDLNFHLGVSESVYMDAW